MTITRNANVHADAARWLNAFLVTLGLLAVSLTMLLAQGRTSGDFFKETFDEMLRADPTFATATGHHEFNDRWTDWSKAARDSRRQFFATRLAQLDTLPVGDSPQDQLTARLLRYDFALRLEAWDLDTDLLRVGQLGGFHNLVYDTVDLMPARSVRDYENIIARLRSIPIYVDQNLGVLDEAVAAGIMQPRVVADLVVQPEYIRAGKEGALRPGSARAARSDSGSHLSGCGGEAADHAARDPPLLLQ